MICIDPAFNLSILKIIYMIYDYYLIYPFLLFSQQNNTFNLPLIFLRFLLINQLIFLNKFNSHKPSRIFCHYFKFSETIWQISEKNFATG